MKVLFIDTVHPILEEQLRAHGMECTPGYGWSREQILREVGSFQGIVIRSRTRIDAPFFEAAHALKWIARSGSGLENIDLTAAQRHGVMVFNSPEGNAQAVGEHATGMLLNLLNRISLSDAEVRRGVWLREENRGRELNAMRVGLIGYGHTGKAFAKCLSGFGCEVWAYDKYLNNYSDAFATQQPLHTLCEHCDVISFHVPLTAETRHMLNTDFLNQCKDGVIIINTSRGKVCNTEDLVAAMKGGKVFGACLDVHEYETASFESLGFENIPAPMAYLLQSQRTVLTPHVAGWTVESYTKLSEYLAKKILAQFS